MKIKLVSLTLLLFLLTGLSTANIFFNHDGEITFSSDRVSMQTVLDMNDNKIKNVPNLGNGSANLSEPFLGDANGDGRITYSDAGYLVNNKCSSEERCDVNQDGEINIVDVSKLLHWLEGNGSPPSSSLAVMQRNFWGASAKMNDQSAVELESLSARGAEIEGITGITYNINEDAYEELESEYPNECTNGVTVGCSIRTLNEVTGEFGNSLSINGERLRYPDIMRAYNAIDEKEVSDIIGGQGESPLRPVTYDKNNVVQIWGDINIPVGTTINAENTVANFKKVNAKAIDLEPSGSSEEDLPECNESRLGQIRFVKSDDSTYGNSFYVCEEGNGPWSTMS